MDVPDKEPSRNSAFWLLFSVYVRKLSDSAASNNRYSRSNACHLLQNSVIPLLDRFNFLTDCRNLPALESIFDSLRAAGYQLPWQTRKAFCSEVVLRVLTSPSVCEARKMIDFAKRTLDCNFYGVTEAIRDAQSKLESTTSARQNAQERHRFQMRLCLVEEEVCWSICEEERLLQYAMEEEKQAESNDVEMTDGEASESSNSRLASFFRRGLQSQETDVRLQTMKLAVACSFNSYYVFSKLLPLFETSLYLEDFCFREYILAALMDLVYMHHHKLTLSAVAHLLVPFFNGPTERLQLVTVIGCGRLLLFDCYPEETECLLGAMMERYVSDSPINDPSKKFEPVMKALHFFFQEYSGGKKLHQDEIANTLVYLCLEKMEEGVVLLTGEPHAAMVRDNPERGLEAKRLHLALHFGLTSISDNIQDAVLDSLVLNINNNEGEVLTKDACRTWLLSR